MLGTCVFFWGFGYKLSLYETQGPTLHNIPEAKLLSKNEDPNATDSLRLCLASAVAAQSALIAISAAVIVFWSNSVNPPVSSFTARTPEPPSPRTRFILGAFSFRPPPIHVAL
jgi:hypothetical protein